MGLINIENMLSPPWNNFGDFKTSKFVSPNVLFCYKNVLAHIWDTSDCPTESIRRNPVNCPPSGKILKKNKGQLAHLLFPNRNKKVFYKKIPKLFSPLVKYEGGGSISWVSMDVPDFLLRILKVEVLKMVLSFFFIFCEWMSWDKKIVLKLNKFEMCCSKEDK